MFEEIVEEIRSSFYAYPGASQEDLDSAVNRGIPPLLVEFYKECDGCFIGQGEVMDAPDGKSYRTRIPKLAELDTVQSYGYVSNDTPLYDKSAEWWQIVDYGSANWIAFDASDDGFGQILDIPHEEVGNEECHAIIAESFLELLQKLIKYNGQDWYNNSEWKAIGWV